MIINKKKKYLSPNIKIYEVESIKILGGSLETLKEIVVGGDDWDDPIIDDDDEIIW